MACFVGMQRFFYGRSELGSVLSGQIGGSELHSVRSRGGFLR